MRHRLDLVGQRHARTVGLLLMACGTESDTELRCIEAGLSMLLSLKVGLQRPPPGVSERGRYASHHSLAD